MKCVKVGILLLLFVVGTLRANEQVDTIGNFNDFNDVADEINSDDVDDNIITGENMDDIYKDENENLDSIQNYKKSEESEQSKDEKNTLEEKNDVEENKKENEDKDDEEFNDDMELNDDDSDANIKINDRELDPNNDEEFVDDSEDFQQLSSTNIKNLDDQLTVKSDPRRSQQSRTYIKWLLKKSKIRGYPQKLVDLLIMLKNSQILRCIPKYRRGNCFVSRRCSLPNMKILGKQFSATLHICTRPWVIKIYLQIPRIKWWGKLSYDPIIIPVNGQNGVTEIHFRSRGNGKLLGILKAAKAELQVDGIFRYDCTKPRNNQAARAKYNMQAPNRRYNAVFYKLKVRLEVKRRHPLLIGIGRWRYWKCETVFNKQEIISSGPRRCISDTTNYINRQRKKWCVKK